MAQPGAVYVEDLSRFNGKGHLISGTLCEVNEAPNVTLTATTEAGGVFQQLITPSGCTGRALPSVKVGFATLHTKYEDKWLISEGIPWPSPSASVHGKDRSSKHIVAPTVTPQMDYLTKQFTHAVHAGRGCLVSFDDDGQNMMGSSTDSVDKGLRDVSVRTAPAMLNGNGSSHHHPPVPSSAHDVHIHPRSSLPAGAKSTSTSVYVSEAPEPPKYSIYACFDGHNGHEAPEYLMHVFRKLLHARLPPVLVLPQKGTAAFQAFLQDIRHAIARAVVAAERNFAAAGHLSGTTVTICVLVDWVLTVANLGDSSCFLDNGETVMQLTEDHNLEASPNELKRIRDAGVLVARLSANLDGPAREGSTGLGPLRCWPGGLCLTRTFGDFDAPEALVSAPLMKQVLLPERGCRVVIASDGLWAIQNDELAREVLRKSRNLAADRAATFLVNKARTSFGLKDDVTVIVIDVMPRDTPSFAALFPKSSKRPANTFSCFCGSPAVEEPVHDQADAARSARSLHVEMLASVDYGDPPLSSAEARALHEQIVDCKRGSYAVFHKAMEIRGQGGNPLRSAAIQDMCRKCPL